MELNSVLIRLPIVGGIFIFPYFSISNKSFDHQIPIEFDTQMRANDSCEVYLKFGAILVMNNFSSTVCESIVDLTEQTNRQFAVKTSRRADSDLGIMT